MSHIAQKAASSGRLIRFNRLVAAIEVEVVGKKKLKLGALKVAKLDTDWVKLPSELELVSQSGEILPPSDNYYISVETFDPFHLVTQQSKV